MARRPTISIKTLLDNAGLSRGVGEAEGILGGFGGRAGTALKAGLAGAGVTAAAALGKGFLDALDQQQLGSQIGAQLGLDDAEQRQFLTAAADIYEGAWGDSLETVALARAEAVRAFGDTADVDALTESAFAISSAFGGDVNATIQDATELMQSFGISGGEAMDLLAAGASGVTSEVRDELSAAMREFGGQFNAVGLSAEETLGFLTTMGQDGARAVDLAANAILELTVRGTDMSAASVEAFEAAGLNAEDMAAALLAGGDVAGDAMQQIAAGLLTIEDPVEQAAAALALMGTPLEDLGVDQIPAMLETLSDMKSGLIDTEGAAAAMGDAIGDNLSTKFEALKRRGLQVLADVMTDHVIPVLERFAAWWEENWPQIQATVQRVMAVVVPVIQRAMATIGEIIREVVAIVTAIWEQWGDEILAFVEDVWPSIERYIKGVTDVIVGILKAFSALIRGDWSALWDAVKQIFTGAWDVIVGFFETYLKAIKAIFGAVFDGIKAVVGEAIEAVVTAATEWPVDVVEAIAGFAQELYDEAKAAFGEVLQAMKDTLGAIGQWLRDNVLGPILNIVDEIAGAFGRLKDLNPFDGSFLGFDVGIPGIDVFHDGGTVTRLPSSVSSSLGIGRNERPILAEAGEVVLTEEQQRQGMGGGPLIGVMNVTNDRSIDQEIRLAQALRAAS